MNDKMILTVAPHIRSKDSTKTIMRDVLIALIPALIAAVIHYGARTLLVTAVCLIFTVYGEWLFEFLCDKPKTINDLSAAVTGLILALNLPVGIPLWMAAIGSLAASMFVKQLFGGLGQNFANPAITARIIMFVSFASAMTDWETSYPVAIAGATPLKLAGQAAAPSYKDLFFGNIAGSMGETCKFALLIGFIYLLVRKVIKWYTPVAFIGTVFVFTALLGQDPLYQILSGGLFLGAIFMATDYATTPSNTLGRVVFGIGAGFITVVIRTFCSYPEGVSFAILLMNILTPHIENLTESHPIGVKKPVKGGASK